MELMEVSKLKAHPQNGYFFDDITGENWEEFLESVKTSGVIEPLVITQNCVIVSGHQRVRACKELGLDKVLVDMRNYESEDKLLKDLIETNIRQRGIGNPNAVKLGRCIKELERIYGIKLGNNQHSEGSAIGTKLTENDLAKEFGICMDTLKRAKKLADLPEELQQMVEEGNITASTASRVIARLSKEEQEKLMESLDHSTKYTQKQVQAYIDRITELEAREPEVKEVPPADYGELKEKAKKINQIQDDFKFIAGNYERSKEDLNALKGEYDALTEKWKQAEKEKEKLLQEKLQESKDDPQAVELHRSALMFNAGIANFIEEFGGYIWITAHLDIMQESDKKGFLSGITALDAWVCQMKANLGGGLQ